MSENKEQNEEKKTTQTKKAPAKKVTETVKETKTKKATVTKEAVKNEEKKVNKAKVATVAEVKPVKEKKVVKKVEKTADILDEFVEETPVATTTVIEKKIKKEKVKKERMPFKMWIAEHKATVIIVSIVIGLLLVLGILLTVFFVTDGSKVAVKYNSGSITKVVYDTYYKLFSPILQYYYGYPDEASIKAEIANKAVLDKLILADIDRSGMNITLTEEEKQGIEEQLADKERVASYEEQGIDLGVLKQLFYEDIRITKYLDAKKKAITDDKAKEYTKTAEGFKNKEDLNKYVTRHILFKIDEKATDEEKAAIEKKANEVLTRIKNGEKIADLAAEFSDDSTKSDGGKYEMVMDGNTVEQYATAVKMLTVGSVTQNLVKTDYGYHIIELSEVIADGRLDSIKDEMVNNELTKMQKDANIQPVAKVIAEIKI